MTEPTTKTCHACQSSIHEAALRCPACQERQLDAPGLHRGVSGKVLGGVCASLASHFNLDVTLVRVLFVASLAVTGPLVFWVYPALWLMTPASAFGRAPLARFFDALSRAFTAPAQPRLEQPVDR